METKTYNSQKYLFIIGWFEGSPSAEDRETGVKTETDLLPIAKGEKKGEVDIFEIEAESEDIAHALGCRKAFLANYTAADSVSILIPKGE